MRMPRPPSFTKTFGRFASASIDFFQPGKTSSRLQALMATGRV